MVVVMGHHSPDGPSPSPSPLNPRKAKVRRPPDGLLVRPSPAPVSEPHSGLTLTPIVNLTSTRDLTPDSNQEPDLGVISSIKVRSLVEVKVGPWLKVKSLVRDRIDAGSWVNIWVGFGLSLRLLVRS
ncbi:hypothetical protein HAX54_040104 [Datura stramonium]|uniref:Uncharacterized protein n=1 Tax=Datura stramonium TaxID=4076 RepID=A0ABS8SJK9_DATST|nr:hypothetical protein [Datura stramonium]